MKTADKPHPWDPFALLLIDVQGDFWHERQAAAFPRFPENVARLLAFCRSSGIEVVHLRARFRADMSDWMPVYRLRGRIPCVEGTPGVETLPFAREAPGETVLAKTTFDGFHVPQLVQHLRAGRKQFILTAGLITSVCVLLTTASAVQHGFLAAVVEDCCADEPGAHAETLERYQFIFERTTVDGIAERREGWLSALEALP